ncbi:ammonia-dependent NAD(+) synthetase [Pseudalkalibacillus caeni]|uniref:NH(3)-dependent NAD(+) synthetase n=1 Tax=Exobacillus caeni TaxID=2574798 RepID=A0A5R9FFP1_9BACL|nr:ammonia-dependent NAD(+) synthetase [Pseudalkalibacillus caeni]TLS39424.1 ammonia-dependent NAD(+) synthetase [Pseudalkalibacillus caeni]
MQKHIIEQLKVKPSIDPKQEVRTRIDFLKDYLKETGMNGYVLGISGGQDSTLAGRLAQIAVEELREETEKEYSFIGVRLPYGVQQDEEDAQKALKFVNPDKIVTINIKPAVDASTKSYIEATGKPLTDFTKGNNKARERMVAQYDIAGDEKMLVIGTDHAAEAVTGFFTKHGDGACDIVPLFGLNKRQGKELLKELQSPEHLYMKVPTADLEDNKPGLPDEDALGITYNQIDDYLEGKEIEEKAAKKIETYFLRSRHKRLGAVSIFDDWWK